MWPLSTITAQLLPKLQSWLYEISKENLEDPHYLDKLDSTQNNNIKDDILDSLIKTMKNTQE